MHASHADIADPVVAAAPSQVAPPALRAGTMRPMRQRTLLHLCVPCAPVAVPAAVAAAATAVDPLAAAAAPSLAVPIGGGMGVRHMRQQTLDPAWLRPALAAAGPVVAAAAAP